MGKTKNTWSFENSSFVFAAKQNKKWKKLRVDVAHYHQRKSSFLSVLLLMFCVSHKRSVGLCHHMLEVVGIWFKCQNLTFWVFYTFCKSLSNSSAGPNLWRNLKSIYLYKRPLDSYACPNASKKPNISINILHAKNIQNWCNFTRIVCVGTFLAPKALFLPPF